MCLECARTTLPTHVRLFLFFREVALRQAQSALSKLAYTLGLVRSHSSSASKLNLILDAPCLPNRLARSTHALFLAAGPVYQGMLVDLERRKEKVLDLLARSLYSYVHNKNINPYYELRRHL